MTDLDSNVEYEQIVLGSMILGGADVIDAVNRVGVTAVTFPRPAHILIYQAIMAAYDLGDPVEPFALATRLTASGDLAGIGGPNYLHTITAIVPTTQNATHYAIALVELARWRQLREVQARLAQLVEQAASSGRTVDEVTDFARNMLDDLTTQPGTPGPVAWADLVSPGLASIEAGTGEASGCVPTGIIDLDKLLGGGFKAGQQIIAAGRTSMGKSVLARNFVRHAAFRLKVPAVLFTMEMTADEVFRCVLSAETRIPLHAINNSAELSDDDWTRLARFVGDAADVPLFIDDTAGITLAQIRATCRRLQKRAGLGLVVVDYLQLVTTVGRQENRQVAIAELSRGLKVLAQELAVPVVVVSQLNRGPEQRADKRPALSDMRESGAIENDANVVILVYREDYYDQESPRAGEADLIVAKNRGGPTDTITVAAQLHVSRFVDMAVI